MMKNLFKQTRGNDVWFNLILKKSYLKWVGEIFWSQITLCINLQSHNSEWMSVLGLCISIWFIIYQHTCCSTSLHCSYCWPLPSPVLFFLLCQCQFFLIVVLSRFLLVSGLDIMVPLFHNRFFYLHINLSWKKSWQPNAYVGIALPINVTQSKGVWWFVNEVWACEWIYAYILK